MRNPLYIVLLWAFWGAQSFAQNQEVLRGAVSSGENRLPLPGATRGLQLRHDQRCLLTD